jgi:hypothetical protein
VRFSGFLRVRCSVVGLICTIGPQPTVINDCCQCVCMSWQLLKVCFSAWKSVFLPGLVTGRATMTVGRIAGFFCRRGGVVIAVKSKVGMSAAPPGLSQPCHWALGC